MDVLCSNFVKFSRREIGEIVRCLPDKKNNFARLSSHRYGTDRAENLPGPAPNNVLRVLQISSKRVHFRRSYSRTREHHQNAPISESYIRLKLIFKPNNQRTLGKAHTAMGLPKNRNPRNPLTVRNPPA